MQILGSCCSRDFCVCSALASYHVDCPAHTRFCPNIEDCVREDKCGGHVDTCCSGGQ